MITRSHDKQTPSGKKNKQMLLIEAFKPDSPDKPDPDSHRI